MITFEQSLTPNEWVEVLDGYGYLAFDILAAVDVQIYFTETNEAPTGDGNSVQSWPSGWDFECVACDAGYQWIWAKGNGSIRGVRA